MAERARFYYDVGSPWCWLLGERVQEVAGEVPEWVPVHGLGDAADRGEVEAAATRLGLGEVRWPEPFPFDSRAAMLAATFAKHSGRAVAFSLAAMRQAFLGGRDLAQVDNVLIAAAACELHPRAVLKGIETRSVREALEEATRAARSAGVGEVPCVVRPDGSQLWRP